MSHTPDTTPAPSTDPASAGGPGGFDEAAFEVMRADAVLTGRAMSAAEYLAGILAAAELDTAGMPRKLPIDLWPDADPALVQEVWDRACVVAWRAHQFASSAWLHRDRLQDLQAQLSQAGFHAMAGSVGRSLRLVVPDPVRHPADGEEPREH
jgi:hypothetical protein